MPDELLTYLDLCWKLGGSKPLSLRQVKRIVARFESIFQPVRMGHRTVRFRPSRVEAFISRRGECRL